MSRIQPGPRDQQDSSQQKACDELTEICGTAFGPSGSKFIYKDESGAFIGPLSFMLASPQAGLSAMQHVVALSKLSLPPDAKETAILACGAHYKAVYELYAHGELAQKTGALSKDQVESIKAGKKPDDLSEACGVAFDAASYLSGTPGPLPQHLWDKCIKAFGQDGTVALVHYVGFYAYTCIILNACDAKVPGERDQSAS